MALAFDSVALAARGAMLAADSVGLVADPGLALPDWTPIAVDVAASVGFDPFPFALAVTFAASAALLTPVGYQTNLMVYAPTAPSSRTSPAWARRSSCCSRS